MNDRNHNRIPALPVVVVILLTLVVGGVLALRGCGPNQGGVVAGEVTAPPHEAARRQVSARLAPAETTTSAPQMDSHGFVRPPCQPYGIVRWASGEAAEDARIEVFIDPRFEGTRRMWIDTGVRTNGDGAYELPAQPSCPYRLAASVADRGRGEEEFSAVGGSPPMAGRVQRDLWLELARRLSGRVISGDSQPLEGVEVALASALAVAWEGDTTSYGRVWEDSELFDVVAKRWARTVQTDEDGRFFFDAIREGSWVLHAEADGYEPARGDVWIGQDTEPEEVTLTLKPIEPWIVRAMRSDGSAVRGAFVAVRSRSHAIDEPTSDSVPPTASAVTDANGEVQFQLSCVGGCSISAQSEGLSYASTSVKETPLAPVELRLGLAGSVVGVFEPAPGKHATCLVIGRPTDLTRIQFDDAIFVREFDVAANGGFRLDSVASGECELRFSCGPATLTQDVDVPEGAQRNLGTLQLSGNWL